VTPSEMRQRAYRSRAQATALDESARVLHSVAAGIRGLLSGLVGMSRMVWQGPAATHFEEEAARQSSNLDEQAQVLSGEAGGFESKAIKLRREATWLLAEADRAEAQRAAAGAPIGAS